MKHIKRFKNFRLVTENPDAIPWEYAVWKDDDARPFWLVSGRAYIGERGTNHAAMIEMYGLRDYDYSGRIWLDKKLISFWNYPEPEELYDFLEKATFLKENDEAGEGIVIKNYGYKNKYGRQSWAKVIRSEFRKKKKERVMNSLKPVNEHKFVDDCFTEHYCRKEMLKFLYEKKVEYWDSKFMKEFVETVFHELISEEFSDFLFTFKKLPTINFGTIRCFIYRKVMEFTSKDKT